MRTRNINMNQEITNATKNFLSNYLAKKYKVENDIYLSFYVSEDDNDDLQISRSVRFTNILRKIELTLESQLYPKLAKIFIDQFIKLDPVEIIRSNKMSVGFFISESFSGFIFIPFPVCETIVVARSLHLKPILSWLKSGDQFYMITLSSKSCRLIKGDSFTFTDISSVELSSVSDESNKHNDKKTKLKLISQAENVFYQYVKNDNLPIILGGTDEVVSLYKKINRDPDVLKERIVGNLDKSNFIDLHLECLKILDIVRIAKDQTILANFQEMKYCGKVIEELNEITIAAIQGRVRNLIVASDRFLWGSLDNKTGKITSHVNKNLAIPEDDILDDLAEIVIARGGSITVLKHNEMPSDNEAIALLK